MVGAFVLPADNENCAPFGGGEEQQGSRFRIGPQREDRGKERANIMRGLDCTPLPLWFATRFAITLSTPDPSRGSALENSGLRLASRSFSSLETRCLSPSSLQFCLPPVTRTPWGGYSLLPMDDSRPRPLD